MIKKKFLTNYSLITLTFFTFFFFTKVYSLNPLSKDQKSIIIGKELYKNICANCHGDNAQGKDNGFFLSPNLRVFDKGYKGFINILTNGYGRMPAWGGRSKLSVEQLNQLAAYIEKISLDRSYWEK